MGDEREGGEGGKERVGGKEEGGEVERVGDRERTIKS